MLNSSVEVTEKGFVVRHGGYTTKNVGMSATRDFVAPSSVVVDYHLLSGKKQNFKLHFTPGDEHDTVPSSLFLT